MNNSKPKNDKDDFDDDFDLEDLQDLDDNDDMSDDDWDDAANEVTADPTSSASANQESPAKLKKSGGQKTFFQKNFNAIVITVTALGGGALIFGNVLSPDAPPQAVEENVDLQGGQFDISETPETAEELSSGNLPPMPAPIDPSATESAPQTSEIEQEVLTPMPGASSLAETPLAELGIEETPEELPVATPEAEPMEASGEIAELEIAPAEITELPTPAMEEAEPVTEVAEEELAPPPATNADEKPTDIALTPEQEPVATAAELETLNAANTARMDDFSARLDGMESRISSLNTDLSDKISSTDGKIDNLVNAVSALEKQLGKLADAQAEIKAQQESAPIAATPKEPAAPAEIVVAPKEKPASVQPPAASTPAKAQTATNDWQLRSAQPGKAVLAPKGSNDLKTVEIGDTLPGLGRITSIAVEDGKWVVQGTKGRVSQ